MKCEKMMEMYDLASGGISKVEEGDENYVEISKIPPYLIAQI